MADGWNGHTQGMTIRDILEKVDLFNVSVQNTNNHKGSEKHLSKDLDGKTIIESNDPASAYLGPKLWDKQISLDLGLDLDTDDSSTSAGTSSLGSLGVVGRGRDERTSSTSSSSSNDLTSQVMNMEEFLAENGLTLDMEPTIPMEICSSPEQVDSRERSVVVDIGSQVRDVKPAITRPNVIMNVPKVERRTEIPTVMKRQLEVESEGEADDPGVTKKQPANDFLYAESKRARLEREKAEKRRKFELELEFAPEDLALATVPGAQFDPSTRTFDVDELRPQPIIRKRKRIYVPDTAKDDKYWANRIKNNVAARRSREARRLKENQIALRAAFLEKENRILKQEVDDVKFENTKLATERDILKMKLAKYEG